MVLNLVQLEESLVFQTGQDVMAGNGVVLFGMSPGNPYFKSHVIEDYVQYLGKEKRRIIVVVPQQPAEHTYRALGSKDAVKRAKKNSSQLKSHCRRAIDRVCTENIIILSLINSWYFKKASKSTVKYPPQHLCLSLFFYKTDAHSLSFTSWMQAKIAVINCFFMPLSSLSGWRFLVKTGLACTIVDIHQLCACVSDVTDMFFLTWKP